MHPQSVLNGTFRTDNLDHIVLLCLLNAFWQTKINMRSETGHLT